MIKINPMPGLSRVRIELLGVPRLVRPDGVAHFLERHDAGLLAMLVIEVSLHRQRAASLLWPDTLPASAQNNLRQRLFKLKRMAGATLIDAGGGNLLLAGDVLTDCAEVPSRLAADSAACKGELLGGLDYEDLGEFAAWVALARTQWRAERGERLAQIADQLEAQGCIAQALPYARRLVADEVLDEHAHRRVIRLHYRDGDRAAALAAYQRCRRLLADELGADPAAETRELARLVERSEPLEGRALRSPGSASPAAAAAAAVAVLRPPRLIGRDAEWARALQAWQRGRLVLLRGEPGVGKSRFAGDFARTKADAPICAARPGDATLPYALLARLLRLLVERYGPPAPEWVRHELAHLVPELAPVVTPRVEALRLRQALKLALAQLAGRRW